MALAGLQRPEVAVQRLAHFIARWKKLYFSYTPDAGIGICANAGFHDDLLKLLMRAFEQTLDDFMFIVGSEQASKVSPKITGEC